MNLAFLARQFACQTPDKMRWEVKANIGRCAGCSGDCGRGWPLDESTPEELQAEPEQQLTFAL